MTSVSTRLRLQVAACDSELVHGLTQHFWSVGREQGVHEDDVTARQAALDDGRTSVKVGVARQHDQR